MSHRFTVVKHCRPLDRDSMLGGSFRIGTSLDYSTMEGGGLLDDHKEGHASLHLVGDQHFSNTHIPSIGITLSNVSFIGGRVAIALEFAVDTYVFCTSDGAYCHARHMNMLRGTDQYQPNPGLTAYVTLDKVRLGVAITSALAEQIGRKPSLLGLPVRYDGRNSRHTDQSAFLEPDATQRAAFKAVFHKPESYQLEEEYRYMAVGRSLASQPLSPFYTTDMPIRIRTLFQNAIVTHGDLKEI